MIYYDNIPLAPILYEAINCYYYLDIISHRAEEITVEQQEQGWRASFIMREITKKEFDEWRKENKLDIKVFRKVSTFVMPSYDADFMVAMPFGVWDYFKKYARELKTGPRKTAARVFAYIYYWAMRFQGSYSHSREDMVRELGINKDNLARSLEWLEKKELIVRTDYSKQEGYSRRYYIPEKLWNLQCKKEWQNTQKSLKDKR